MYVWGSFAAVRAHETRADQEGGGIINVCPVVCPFGSYVLPLIHIPLRPSGPFGTRGKETILAAILVYQRFGENHMLHREKVHLDPRTGDIWYKSTM